MTKGDLTKRQRSRANQKARKDQFERFEREMGPMPEHLKSAEVNINVTEKVEREPIEKAPAYMRDSSDPSGNYAWNDDRIAKTIKKANSARSREQHIAIKELKEKYPDYWGKRGGAKFISLSEFEFDPEHAPSERTVQEYFKKTRN